MFTPLVERLHASPFKFNIITTGAGASAIAALMAVPGCSKTLINAQVPYASAVSQKILDHQPAKFVSPEIGRQLAQHAYTEALTMVETPASLVIGVGATAALRTGTVRRGEDAVYVSAWSKSFVKSYAVLLSKDLSRNDQEVIVVNTMLRAMAESASLDCTELPALDDMIRQEFVDFPSPVASVLSGTVKCALFNHHGDVRIPLPPYGIEDHDYASTIFLLYPGSFKPLHWGHTELARVAGQVMQRYQPEKKKVVITYEISASIVGKRDVCEEDFGERIAQFTAQGRRVAITTAKLFVEKAEMFPNHGLVVGIDTARRVIDKQYYDDDDAKMLEAMSVIDKFGCYFVVGGRKHGDTWDDLSCLDIPQPIRHMFKGINPADFRVDISSTEIRARRMSASDLSLQ